MNDDTNFPAVSEGTIGGALVQTVDGRELHGFLKNGDHFSTWIKDRIRVYDFAQDIDYVSFSEVPENGGPPKIEYAISIDMAKELAMVERNGQGKRARRYFIECEKRLRSALPSEALESLTRTNGICRMLINKVTGMEKAIPEMAARIAADLIPAMVQSALGAQNLAVRRGKTAGQIWKEAGFPKLKITSWFSNRLREMKCEIDGQGRGELGLSTARLFDPDKADAWLRNGGRMMVENKIAERRGQQTFRLVPKEKKED